MKHFCWNPVAVKTITNHLNKISDLNFRIILYADPLHRKDWSTGLTLTDVQEMSTESAKNKGNMNRIVYPPIVYLIGNSDMNGWF